MKEIKIIQRSDEAEMILLHLYSVYVGYEDRTSKTVAKELVAGSPYLRAGHSYDIVARHVGVGVYAARFVKCEVAHELVGCCPACATNAPKMKDARELARLWDINAGYSIGVEAPLKTEMDELARRILEGP